MDHLVSAKLGGVRLEYAGVGRAWAELVWAGLDRDRLKRSRLGMPHMLLVELNYAGLGRTGYG